ncbi:hypothetical protein [Paradevosia shaoguanensis]|uniref:hypothetical protein n=1 Tax=Paradevosia shaoguanensis TaxID=1335043 RepID=UPI003C7536E8
MTDNVVNLNEHSSRHENDVPPTPTADVKSQGVLIGELTKLAHDMIDEASGHQDKLRTHLQRAAQLAEKLTDDPDQWEAFVQLRDWEIVKRAPKLTHRADALRFVVRWLFLSQTDGSKLSNKYYKAVKALLDDGFQPSEVAGGLKERGIEALAYPNSTTRKDRPSAITEQLQSLVEEHGKPLFILKLESKLDTPLPDGQLTLTCHWVPTKGNRGHFAVYKLQQDTPE